MTPSTPDVGRVTQRLRLLQEALDELGALSDQIHSDSAPVTRAAAERFIQVIVDLALDVNAHIAVSLGGASPETGRVSFLALVELGVLPDELANALAPRAGLRNLLVHHYADVNFALVANEVAGILDDFTAYVRTVAAYAASLDQP